MELATGPLPPRAAKAMPIERRADAWADFLQRVLPSAAPFGETASSARFPEGLPPRATPRPGLSPNAPAG